MQTRWAMTQHPKSEKKFGKRARRLKTQRQLKNTHRRKGISGTRAQLNLLDPDPHLSMRIQIQEASEFADPDPKLWFWTGLWNIINFLRIQIRIQLFFSMRIRIQLLF